MFVTIDALFRPCVVGLLAVYIFRYPAMAMVKVLSFAAMIGTVFVIKHVTRVERPDRSDRLSFPSGHAAVAMFIAALYSVGIDGTSLVIFAWACAVCASRVALKRHRVIDVLVGGCIGWLFG